MKYIILKIRLCNNIDSKIFKLRAIISNNKHIIIIIININY